MGSRPGVFFQILVRMKRSEDRDGLTDSRESEGAVVAFPRFVTVTL